MTLAQEKELNILLSKVLQAVKNGSFEDVKVFIKFYLDKDEHCNLEIIGQYNMYVHKASYLFIIESVMNIFAEWEK